MRSAARSSAMAEEVQATSWSGTGRVRRDGKAFVHEGKRFDVCLDILDPSGTRQ